MTTLLRHTAHCMLLVTAAYAAPALAQGAAPARTPAMTATAPTGYGAPTPAPVDRRAIQRKREQKLLGAPDGYDVGNAQNGNLDDARRAALLDEQRMTANGAVQGGQPGPAADKRKAPGGQLRVADAAARPRAADKLLPEGAAKATYSDPYATGKRSVYRSPW